MSIDLLYDIQTVQINPGTWDVTMISQPNSNQALRMGGASITLRLYGSEQSAIAQAKQFMIHNGIGS
jgi:hypothetical protein